MITEAAKILAEHASEIGMVRNGVKLLNGEDLSMVSKKNYIDKLQNTDMDDVKESLSGAAETLSETAGGIFDSVCDFLSRW